MLTAAGVIAGALIALLAHVAPMFGAGNYVRDLDQPRLLGKSVTRRESHLFGIVVHLVVSGFGGFAFAWSIGQGLFQEVSLLALLVWSCVICLFTGGIILPLEGHGVFGIKEDAWFPVDLVLSHLLWGVLIWFVMQLWIVAR